jgi:DNA invertase Pin-like site-specific DNA recombinase
MTEVKRRLRCAVYTRKSTEEGLDMEFNSLDAQREAGEAYVLSQRHEGWTLAPDYYDDGGFSGGSMERPALKRLMKDIESGLIDVIVVYKVDRLSRSLMDFAKLVETFDKHNVSFVSVTQQFNTTTSMGRLTLNILLSFAQFEREVIGERIRDKFAASKRKGMWMGGPPPLGYDVVERKLIVNEAEAKQVLYIFERFITLRSTTMLMKELKTTDIRTKTYITQTGNQKEGRFINKNQIYRTLHNRLYLGEMPHKEKSYPGQHKAIIGQKLWDEAHTVMQVSPRSRGRNTITKTPALLKGIVRCGGCKSTMSPTHSLKNGKHYRYYKPSQVLKGGCETCPIRAIPAGELEGVVLNHLRQTFKAPDMIVKTWAAANAKDSAITEQEVRKALHDIDPVWNELFPAEQARIVNLLIEHITVDPEGIDIKMRAEGLESLARDVASYQKRAEGA